MRAGRVIETGRGGAGAARPARALHARAGARGRARWRGAAAARRPPRPRCRDARGARRCACTFPLRSAGFARARALHAVERGQLRAARRRGARGRRGVRQRQVDARARGAAAAARPAPAASCGWASAVEGLPQAQLRARRGALQIIFQDPLGEPGSAPAGREIVAEGLQVHAPALESAGARAGGARDARAASASRAELRAALPARALRRAVPARRHRARDDPRSPSVLVCDEPLSALDLLQPGADPRRCCWNCRRTEGLALLFISHNLADGAPPVRPGAGHVPAAA